MKARLAAAGLIHGAARPAPPGRGRSDEPASARVAEARSRARERGDAQRQALRPLGVVFIAVVVTASAQAHPAPGLQGAGLGVTFALAVYTAAVATAISVALGSPRRGRAGRGERADRRLRGGTGRLAAERAGRDSGEHGSLDRGGQAAARPGRCRRRSDHGRARRGRRPDCASGRPAAITATLLCLLLAVTGQFIRRGRESQDRTDCCWPSSRTHVKARPRRPRWPSGAASQASCTTCSRTRCPAWPSSFRVPASSPTGKRSATDCAPRSSGRPS